MSRRGNFKAGEGEWQTVQRRKQRSFIKQGVMDVAGSGWKENSKDTQSFYFSEIPDNHGAKEMLRAFSNYGEVVEVVIPPKRNGRGLRFGFARFRNVTDPRVFAIRLDNIIIGAKKIFVNVPRFERNRTDGRGAVAREGMRKDLPNMGWRKMEAGKDEGEGRGSGNGYHNRGIGSANGVWHGGARKWEGKKMQADQVVYFRKKNYYEMSYDAEEEEMEKLRKMFVGLLRNSGSSYMVQEWFNMQGIFSIKATPLGANLVLLEEFEEGMLAALSTDAADWFWDKFEDVRSWSPSVVDIERVVWVRCHGIPAHAWNNDFFGRLARNFGVFLGVDENTRKRSSMDVARILIRTRGLDVFNAVIYAKINGEMSHIKVLEEWCGPMHWNGLTSPKDDGDSVESSDSEEGSDGDDGPPLFTDVNDAFIESDSDGDGGKEEDGSAKKTMVIEGVVLENVVEDNHVEEGENVALGTAEDAEDVISSNVAAQVESEECGKQEKSFAVNVKDGAPNEVKCQSAEVVEEWLDERGPLNGGILIKTTIVPEVDGSPKKAQDDKVLAESVLQKGDSGASGAGKKNQVENRGKKKKENKMRKEKNKRERQKGQCSNSKGETGGITVGIVSEEGRKTFHSVHSSSQSLGGGVLRKPPNSNLSFSINNPAGEDVLGESSFGDSDIRLGNARIVVQHEISLAKKVWSIAKEDLGVSGAGNDDVYGEKNFALEKRDKEAKGRKENQHGSQ